MWEIHVNDQTLTFLYALIGGAALCLVYDLIRAVRANTAKRKILETAVDIVYWIAAAFATFLFLLARTNGEIRGYAIAAEFAGFIVMRKTMSRLIFPALSFVARTAFRLFGAVRHALKAVFDKISVFSSRLFRKIAEIAKNVIKSIKKLLKNISGMLYTKKNI